MGSKDFQHFQVFIQVIVKDQSEEARHYVLTERNPALQHLAKMGPRSEVNLAAKTAILGKTRTLPPEIQDIIYSFCSLETCVQLREVDSSWYTAFQHSEQIFKAKLNARCPWIFPEGDMGSWAACALVFGKRRLMADHITKLWNTKNRVDAHPINLRHAPPVNLMALELRKGEKMPKNFFAIDSCDIQCSKWCDDVHPPSPDGTKFSTGTLSYETGPIDDAEMEIFDDDDEDEVVIQYEVFIATLPPKTTFPPENSGPHIKILRNYLLVRTLQGMWVLPRGKNIANYTQGTRVDGSDFSVYIELGSVLVRRDDVCGHQFYNPHTRSFVKYEYIPRALPVAAFKGIIWWVVFNRDMVLVPTFMDLETPGVVYTNNGMRLLFPGDFVWAKKKNNPLCEVKSSYYHDKFHQFQQENSRFLVRQMQKESFEVIDLAKRTITIVDAEGQQGKRNPPHFFPGYMKDKFQVMFLDGDTMREYSMNR
ncbi:hypothetical protein CJU89_4979 [Yarrowia sp. B02]|nr:hypothetical protein CJU89_4979 [Yarrowia sp. B02]